MSASSSSTSTPTDAPRKSTLTPQRKHRKLLKDGSGSEVWPEKIEGIFIQGLREYWNSPWAAYSQSRGRSRWRNQFLVDYLQKAGIARTKKQVASHIQVLRNMWKGEPEFYLVAAGEELLLESELSDPVKLEDRSDTNALIPLDFDEDATSSNTTSPDFSPPDLATDFPPSPVQALNIYSASPEVTPVSIQTGSPVSPASNMELGFLRYASSTGLTISPFVEAVSPSSSKKPSSLRNSEYSLDDYNSSTLAGLPPSRVREQCKPTNAPHDLSRPYTPSVYARVPHNKVTAFCLLADGMTPFSIKIDALVPAGPQLHRTALALKIRLCITSVDDIRSPSTLHGFVGSICLAKVWTDLGKCITKAYANGVCISEEVGSLDISNVEIGTAIALLPESSLSRCRWLDPSIQTTLTQEIVVDGETLIYIVYNLDRRSGGAMPSAELLGYQKYQTTTKPVGWHQSSSLPPSHLPVASAAHTFVPPSQPAPCVKRTTQTSLSCALTPVNNIRHTVSTSMSI